MVLPLWGVGEGVDNGSGERKRILPKGISAVRSGRFVENLARQGVRRLETPQKSTTVSVDLDEVTLVFLAFSG